MSASFCPWEYENHPRHGIVDVTWCSDRLMLMHRPCDPSVRPRALFAVDCPMCLRLLSATRPPAPRPFRSHQAVLKRPSCPAVQYDFLKVLFVRQNENTVSTQITLGDVTRKTRPNNALLYMQRSGSQDITLLSQPTVIEEIVKHRRKVRTAEEGRKAVLCEELNGASALHSYRVSAEDRVIQPNEIQQHTSSPSEGWLSAPV